MPPASAQQPLASFVRTIVKIVPANRINRICQVTVNTEIYGCSRADTPYQIWHIYLNDAMNAHERACTLTYEQSHMPPNNWHDATVEGWTH